MDLLFDGLRCCRPGGRCSSLGSATWQHFDLSEVVDLVVTVPTMFHLVFLLSAFRAAASLMFCDGN